MRLLYICNTIKVQCCCCRSSGGRCIQPWPRLPLQMAPTTLQSEVLHQLAGTSFHCVMINIKVFSNIITVCNWYYYILSQFHTKVRSSEPIGVWSHQLLMNVNIDTRVFNLYMFIWVRFALLFRGGPVESTFSPESDQTAVGPDQSLWPSLLLVLLLGVCHRIFSSKPRILLSCLLLCHFTPVFRKQKRWFYGSFC